MACGLACLGHVRGDDNQQRGVILLIVEAGQVAHSRKLAEARRAGDGAALRPVDISGKDRGAALAQHDIPGISAVVEDGHAVERTSGESVESQVKAERHVAIAQNPRSDVQGQAKILVLHLGNVGNGCGELREQGIQIAGSFPRCSVPGCSARLPDRLE